MIDLVWNVVCVASLVFVLDVERTIVFVVVVVRLNENVVVAVEGRFSVNVAVVSDVTDVSVIELISCVIVVKSPKEIDVVDNV